MDEYLQVTGRRGFRQIGQLGAYLEGYFFCQVLEEKRDHAEILVGGEQDILAHEGHDLFEILDFLVGQDVL